MKQSAKGREAVRVFISWSGETSHQVADILYEWLLDMNIPALELYLSDEIGKGEKWFDTLARKLRTADGGIFCITKDNVTAPWLLFEAGALCVVREEPFLLPFLFRVDHSELAGPLKQFQYADCTRDDVERMVQKLRRTWGGSLSEPGILEADFEQLYRDLEANLQNVPEIEQEEKEEEENPAEILMNLRQQLDRLNEIMGV